MKNNHIPVLLNEVLDNLALKENEIYIDLTLGMGGHSKEILKRIPKGKLISFDKDDFAIKNASKTLS
ncbi:16S rRNA (cytosine(1402)-N(4))-methyltransferase, partial [Mycoplasmopsis synoviae]